MEGTCGLLTSSSAATAGDGHPAEAGGAAQSGGARLLWEPCHVPSGDPEGGSERPLHQLAWSQALPKGGSSRRLSASRGGCLWLGDCTSRVECGWWSSLHCVLEVEARVLLGGWF